MTKTGGKRGSSVEDEMSSSSEGVVGCVGLVSACMCVCLCVCVYVCVCVCVCVCVYVKTAIYL